MAWLTAAAAVVQVVGAINAGDAAKSAGISEQNADLYQAAQDRVNAGQAIAASQRAAEETQRQGDYAQSRAIALLAASGGGGVTDPGAVTLLSRNAGAIAYESAVNLYQGEDKARTLNAQADAATAGGIAARQGGADRQKGAYIQAFGDLLKGGNSLYQSIGSGGSGPSSGGGGGGGGGTFTGDG